MSIWAALARGFELYNEEVQRVVPAERLLVWQPADGWAPLCEFLEVPVPDAPLPKVNDAAGFTDRIMDAAMAVVGDHLAKQKAAV